MRKKQKKSRFSIELGLSHIHIKSVHINESGHYHLSVSCPVTHTNCRKCGKVIHHAHGHCQESVIEHLPILEQRVFLHVKWPRCQCLSCDGTPTTSFRPSWLSKNGRQTIPYEDYCLKWLINSTIKDVAEKLNTTEEIIEGIISRRVETDINWALISPTKIGLDEIALRKGHKQYLTIISDLSVAHKIRVLGGIVN